MLGTYGNKEERLDLFMKLKRKGIKLSHLAKEINCSVSLVSKYFNRQCNISPEKELRLKEYIDSVKEYEWIRVEK